MARTDSYRQKTKNVARIRALRHAVRILTERRRRMPIVQLQELRQTADFAVSIVARHFLAADEGSRFRRLVQDNLRDWAVAYRKNVRPITPADLRVLYLSGPEPLNDLAVLHHLGVRPQNVCAVEANNDSYRAALGDLERIPSLAWKLHHGELAAFLESTQERFDIIYFDATGSFAMGAPSTARPLLRVFAHGRLAPLSVLITNFAEPGQDEADRE